MGGLRAILPNVDEFTVPEKILLAAVDVLDKMGQSPFSAEALIVAEAGRSSRRLSA